jgi:hypothetical protein
MRHTQFYQLGGINSQSHSGLSILTFISVRSTCLFSRSGRGEMSRLNLAKSVIIPPQVSTSTRSPAQPQQ